MNLLLRQKVACGVALLVVVVGLIAGLKLTIPQSDWQLRPGASITHNWNDLLVIAGRNLRIGFQLLIGTVSFGIYSLIQLSSIGFSFGYTLHSAFAAGVSWQKITWLLAPHTFIEIAGFIVLGAIEFEAAFQVYQKLRYDRLTIDRPCLVKFSKQILAGLLLIIIAAIVEVFITGPIAKNIL